MSFRPFPELTDPRILALLDAALKKAMTLVNGHQHSCGEEDASRMILAERVMRCAATGETDVDRLAIHAVRGFPRLNGEAMIQSHERLRRRAYEIWEQAGRPEGSDRDHWEQAVRETMKKASEYRQHADECRSLASKMQGDARDQLLEMASTWDKLAQDRSDLITRHPELALDGEQDGAPGPVRASKSP